MDAPRTVFWLEGDAGRTDVLLAAKVEDAKRQIEGRAKMKRAGDAGIYRSSLQRYRPSGSRALVP
jgi:hypothetical protein